MGVQELVYRGRRITWFPVRVPDLQMYTNYRFQESSPYVVYDEDISRAVHVTASRCVSLGLRQGTDLLLFVGNTEERTVTTGLSIDAIAGGDYRWRVFDSLIGRWQESADLVPADRLRQGVALQVEQRGFWVLDLKQAV
jgi:hypothetical protein